MPLCKITDVIRWTAELQHILLTYPVEKTVARCQMIKFQGTRYCTVKNIANCKCKRTMLYTQAQGLKYYIPQQRARHPGSIRLID